MLLTEIRFILFFIAVFFVYWALFSNKQRKIWLLASSLIFYAVWDFRLCLILLLSCISSFGCGLIISKSQKKKNKTVFLSINILVNILILAFFKYFDFFSEELSIVLTYLKIPHNLQILNIILPIGLSFYTLQNVGYTIDVFRNKIAATESFLDLILCAVFFPKLLAGPIVNAADFFPQLKEKRLWQKIDVRFYLVMFLIAYVKKTIIYDNLNSVVDHYFIYPHNYSNFDAWIANILWATQIYLDFSAYSEIGISCAGLLGYSLPVNFRFPYFSPNLTSFWGRWHITLFDWFRDYIYFSLGNRKRSIWRDYFNIMITFLVAGLWHGASPTCLSWGAFQGAGLIVQKSFSRYTKELNKKYSLIFKTIGIFFTFYWICVTQIWLKATSTEQALYILKDLLFINRKNFEVNGISCIYVLLFILMAVIHYGFYKRWFCFLWQKGSKAIFLLLFSFACFLALIATSLKLSPFVYFQY